MKISLNSEELKKVIEEHFKNKYNLQGSVEVTPEGASIEVSMDAVSITAPEVKEDTPVEPNPQEPQTITGFMFNN